mmetsp:Transcript_122230/g.260816  ORF Transcript_122230/g.260816 Transcript_122230/m.260816 type:complete len:261 (-) Transcript_122230:445-1227(-)
MRAISRFEGDKGAAGDRAPLGETGDRRTPTPAEAEAGDLGKDPAALPPLPTRRRMSSNHSLRAVSSEPTWPDPRPTEGTGAPLTSTASEAGAGESGACGSRSRARRSSSSWRSPAIRSSSASASRPPAGAAALVARSAAPAAAADLEGEEGIAKVPWRCCSWRRRRRNRTASNWRAAASTMASASQVSSSGSATQASSTLELPPVGEEGAAPSAEFLKSIIHNASCSSSAGAETPYSSSNCLARRLSSCRRSSAQPFWSW